MSHTTTIPLRLSSRDKDIAEDAIRAHLNSLLADAQEAGFVPDEVLDECERWCHHGEVTETRAAEIIASATPREKNILVRYFASQR